jgi:hypothetical protein
LKIAGQMRRVQIALWAPHILHFFQLYKATSVLLLPISSGNMVLA